MAEGQGFAAALGLMLGGTSKMGTGLADGGIIPSGYNNDTFPAMLSTNEAVIPLDRLPQLMGIGKSSGKEQEVVFIIEGRTMRGIMRDAGTIGGLR